MSKNQFRNIPIKSKITLLIMAITVTALILFFALSLVFQVLILNQSMVESLEVSAGMISRLSSGSLETLEHNSAKTLLSALTEDDDVEYAAIYNERNELYEADGNPVHIGLDLSPSRPETGGSRFFQDEGTYKLTRFQPIVFNGQRIGVLSVVSNLNRLKEQICHFSIILLIAMGLVLPLVLFAARRIQHGVTEPVMSLAETARRIREIGDYSVRAEKSNDNEVGGLIDEFNTMLDAVQARDSELQQYRHNLELIFEQRTEELRQHRDEALAAAQAKTEFLANMSHEIRTPMNGVIGVLSLLNEAPLPEEYRRLLETASRSADSLMYIINDILDFSKIDAGMVAFESIPFDLRELMEETASLYVDAINSKTLDILCFIPLDIHCHVIGDPTRLRQILTNLVSNGVKFTAEGHVLLRVECIEVKGDKQLLRFAVIDTGIGVPESLQSRLFDKFTQADGSTTRHYGGTGLGLSVCKQLVELQGGDIGVYSREGEGAEFWFTMQLRMTPASEAPVSNNELAGKRFLIVDDDESSRMIISHYLTLHEISLTSCGGGEEALRLIERSRADGRPFDMVIIDYHMPNMDGLSLARRIRERCGDQVPAMYLLSCGNVNMEQAMPAGFNAVIYKPVRCGRLYDALIGPEKEEAVVEKATREADERELLHGMVLLVDDESINQKVASVILERLGLTTDLATNGREAVQMVETKHYDVVLMDIQMPELSGYEATEIIRAREKERGLERVTIIAMTANALESAKKRCLEVGMDDYISKPIKPEALAARLRPWLSSTRQPYVVPEEQAEEEVSVTGELAAVWDRQRSLQFIGDDEILLHDLVELFLSRNDELLNRLEEAIRNEDAMMLDDAAHAYKSAVGHFAAEPLRRIALKLEMKGKAGTTAGSRELFIQLEQMSELLVEQLLEVSGEINKS